MEHLELKQQPIFRHHAEHTRVGKTKAEIFLYGGGIETFNTGDGFSDVWKYNRTTNNWTWIAGDNFTNSAGNYLQACTPGNGNSPKARYENRTAQMHGCSEVFWTFGGI